VYLYRFQLYIQSLQLTIRITLKTILYITMNVRLFQCGYCDGKEHHVLKGGRRKKIKFPATIGLLKHPTKGFILFDTGYTDRFYKETRRWPYWLYAKMTPVHIKEEEYAVNQLKAIGIAPEEINYIILSHFHADHICGLKDFPNARFICTQEAFQNVIKLKGWKAVTQGILPGLLPKDLAERVWCYDSDSQIQTYNDPIFGPIHDLFGDGHIELIPLPGHHIGQIGARLQTEKGPIFLCADACWLAASYKENRLASGLTKLFLSDWKAFKESIYKLHQYHKAHPQVPIIPTHCAETQAALVYLFE